jgi:hypothetical protein
VIAVRLTELILLTGGVVCVAIVLGVVVVRSVTWMRWRLREEDRADKEFSNRFGNNKSNK